MTTEPYQYRRRSMRLPHYDYAQAGYYFVTLVAQGRAHLFGEIVESQMVLNGAGEIVKRLWDDIGNDFSNVRLHESVIMPNHMHGIIEIVEADFISAHTRMRQNNDHGIETNMHDGSRAEMDSAPTLGTMIQSFKRHTTLQYIQMVKNGSSSHPSTNASGNATTTNTSSVMNGIMPGWGNISSTIR